MSHVQVINHPPFKQALMSPSVLDETMPGWGTRGLQIWPCDKQSGPSLEHIGLQSSFMKATRPGRFLVGHKSAWTQPYAAPLSASYIRAALGPCCNYHKRPCVHPLLSLTVVVTDILGSTLEDCSFADLLTAGSSMLLEVSPKLTMVSHINFDYKAYHSLQT